MYAYKLRVTEKSRGLVAEFVMTSHRETMLYHRSKGVLAICRVARIDTGTISIMQLNNFVTQTHYRSNAKYGWGAGLGRKLLGETITVVTQRWALSPDTLVTLEASGIAENENMWVRLLDKTRTELVRELHSRVGQTSIDEHSARLVSKHSVAYALYIRLSIEKLCLYYKKVGFERSDVGVEDIYFIPMEAPLSRVRHGLHGAHHEFSISHCF